MTVNRQFSHPNLNSSIKFFVEINLQKKKWLISCSFKAPDNGGTGGSPPAQYLQRRNR